jgi:glycosyltransferase involved in cell wall biosynthesis
MSSTAIPGRRTASRPKLLALAPTPGYYHASLFRAVAADPRISLTVLYQSTLGLGSHDPGFGEPIEWDVDQLAGYDYDFVPGAQRKDPRGGFLALRGGEAASFVRHGDYDALWVHGYASLSIWRAVAAARAQKMPVLFREEQTLLHKRPLARRVPRALALRLLFRRAYGLFISSNNRDFFAAHGIPDERLWFTPYAVENDHLRTAARELADVRQDLRASFGVEDDRPIVLFVGKLIPKKQPLHLLEAFAQVRAEVPCALVFAGDGLLRDDLERSARGVPDVHFAGFLNQTELPKAYVAADAFVLPSLYNETFGLVVAEAMNFGLPVIASDSVGCARDLVREGENGLVVRADDVEALAGAIRRIVTSPGERARFGARSLELIEQWTHAAAAKGIVGAVLAATESTRSVAR